VNTKSGSSSTAARVVVAALIALLILMWAPAPASQALPAVTISWNKVHQTIDGFGGSGAFGQANYLKTMGDPARTTILDALFSQTSGAGLSIVRNIVNDGQSGTTIEPSLGTWVWTGDTDQIWLMQQAQNRGTTRFMSTVWSPPGWMKDNNKAVGGSLATSHYQDYADYLAAYVLGYNSRFSLPIYAISLANEPKVNVTWSSCSWTGQQFHDFIANNLTPTFQADGVNVKVMLPENADWDETLANESLADDVTTARVDIVGGHDYHVTLPNTITPFTNALSHGKPVWETEVSELTKANDPSITDGLKWATQVHDFMVADTSAFLFWWLIEGDRSDSEALVQISGSSYTINKRLYTIGNFARFVRPGYVRIDSTASPATNVLTTAYRDPASNKLVLVVVNNNSSSQTLDVVPDGFGASSLTPYITDATRNLAQLPDVPLTGVTLAASSVTTFVVNGAASTCTLAYEAGPNGSLTGTTSQTVDYGADGSAVTAVPDPGYHFVNWSDGSTANPRTDTQVKASIDVTAHFSPGTYSFTLEPGWNLVAAAPGSVLPGPLFAWTGSAYQSTVAVAAWQGYWCKVLGQQTVWIHTATGPQTIDLADGWNLIGNCAAMPASLTLPAGESAFIYDTSAGGYESTAILVPGQGAWVKGEAGDEVVLTPSG
jgi:glucuronoarabinoxylan endo-1,4-beta-xylanase